MASHTKPALGLLVVGALAIIAWRIIQPKLEHASQVGVSDAGEKGSIHIAVDSWVGYFPFCSQQIKSRLNRAGYALQCHDDQADYNDRFKRLKQNEYDFAVATVDSYLLNGEAYGFPGPIIAVVDESKGGDAIVANKKLGSSINELKTVDAAKIAFTPNSPSHHLMKSAATHFDVPLFKNTQAFVETQGSEEALKKLERGEVEVAVLWEPQVSKALKNAEHVRILGTEVTQELIVDILIAGQRIVKSEPEKIKALLKAFFETQKYYRSNPQQLASDLAKHYKLNKATAQTLLQGVAWASLNENAKRWYGVSGNGFSNESLISAINSAASILVESGDFAASPIPKSDPYLLVNSQFIKQLYESYGRSGGFTVAGQEASGKAPKFSALSPEQWQQLQDVGSLKVRKISFASGSAELTQEGRAQVDAMMQDLAHYPLFRVEIRGHTGVRGDKDANLGLSQQRAEAVLNYMNNAHKVDSNRVRAIGFGGSKPLPKRSGESNRAYNYRLPRVEIALVGEIL